ncbi:hypothetical protein [Streptomyces olivaceiscleroticus]|uniref:Uncharacterized protein n=1 Tax=Streptomyces olivaceiscleroticus TaxID=68245 RepID=A0ABP3LL29_9ACTN
MTDHEHAKVCAEYREDGECSCPTDHNQADTQPERCTCSPMTRSEDPPSGPDEDCPTHGNPQILGYCPLEQHELLQAENARLHAELDSEKAKALDYEHRINWFTTCKSCARILDNAYGETVRAEKAEAAIERVRAVLDEYSDDPFAVFLSAAVRAALEGDSK